MATTHTKLVGQPVTRIDGKALVSGQAQFVSDVRLPGILHGKILRSPHAHARILGIDASAASVMPGVVAVLTANEMERFGNVFGQGAIQDEEVLASRKVRFAGDAVAAVIAETEGIAEDALELIKVTYEPLPVVLDPVEGMRPEATLIHEGLEGVKGNVNGEGKVRAGDIAKGLAEADLVVRRRFETPKTQACPMETHQVLASFEEGTGKLTMWASTQNAHVMRAKIASVLKRPFSKVRIIQPYMGGGFGHKIDIFPHDFLAAIGAIITGRPVRFALTREEEFLAGTSRHPAIIDCEMGFKKDGSITALRQKVWVDAGAFATISPHLLKFVLAAAIGPYKIENLWLDGWSVYTNKQAAGAFRGFGNPQNTFVREVMLDIAARELEIDPLEIRRRNLVQVDDLPYTNATGLCFQTLAIAECLESAAEMAGYQKMRQNKPPFRGIGLANMIHWGSVRWAPLLDADTSSAIVKVEDDGSVTILVDSADTGQGHATAFAQICGDELGVSLDRVSVIEGDTAATPYGLGTWGSRTAVVAGSSVRLASIAARKQLFKVAAHLLEAAEEDLEAFDNCVFVKGSPDNSIPISRVASVAHFSRASLPAGTLPSAIIGSATYDAPSTLKDENGYGNFSANYTCSTHVAVVDVDPETGRVSLVDYAVAQDTGRILNPGLVRSQLRGAYAMGLGYTFGEKLIYDEKGIMLNPTFADYQLPTAVDVPDLNKIHLIETQDPGAIDGQKGIGESGLNNVAPAIANAIYDAIGVPFLELPITPDKVLQAMRTGRV
ncbi:MAG: xanthine dehydrogenase family protein molybdopterin-binding subunit [Chloroflexi bacterium]|nr:xanthine dehydrogenase family protein molybdopterin-binding subunit [Chloroflexota bacterium]